MSTEWKSLERELEQRGCRLYYYTANSSLLELIQERALGMFSIYTLNVLVTALPWWLDALLREWVKNLVNTLWYIDGHHHVLKNRNNKVPESLEQFTGYNVPEASKHRKQKLLSKYSLRQLSNSLFTCLQTTYWERSGWESLKSVVHALAISICHYAAYLTEQNKKMKHIATVLATTIVPSVCFLVDIPKTVESHEHSQDSGWGALVSVPRMILL